MILSNQEIALRLLLAIVWGGLIGLEREYHHKPAGFRTMIMISIGSCLFSLLSVLLNNGENDNRITANVVTGIGFLGAGVIFRSSNRINGITTAAAIWAVAAVGMSIGTGFYLMASISSVLIISVLAILPLVEQKMESRRSYREYTIAFGGSDKKEYCMQVLHRHGLKFEIIRESRTLSGDSLTFKSWGKPSDHEAFLNEITLDHSLKNIDYTA